MVLATSAYLVPPEACAGLAEYVGSGGRLLWVDGPARTSDPGLRAVLGLEPGHSYSPLREVVFHLEDPVHPVCFGLQDMESPTAVGNPATQAADGAQVLVTWNGRTTADPPEEATYPAIVATKTGRGLALAYNWIVWLNREPTVRRLVDHGLHFLLADKELQTQPALLRILPERATVHQPEPLRASVRVLARAEHVGARLRVTVRAGDWTSGELDVPLARAGSSGYAMGVTEVEAPTRGRDDGTLEVTARGDLAGSAVVAAPLRVKLSGQLMARLEREEEARHDLLSPLLNGTLGDYDAEPRTEDGHVDIPRLMEQIETAHMNMYDWLIWHSEHDWDDLHEFLPVAKEAGIKVWVTLCPPSEQGGSWPWSEPYRLDFIKWAEEIGKLSREHDNLVGLVIDDFWSGGNRTLFTPEYIGRLAATLRDQNPKVAFLPTIYWSTIGDEAWMEDFRHSIDGIVFPYAELETGDQLAEQLDACREWLGPRKFLLINVYASGSSGTGEKGPRTPEYMRKVLTISREKCDGIRIYCLPKGKLKEDHRYAIAAELYERWAAGGGR